MVRQENLEIKDSCDYLFWASYLTKDFHISDIRSCGTVVVAADYRMSIQHLAVTVERRIFKMLKLDDKEEKKKKPVNVGLSDINDSSFFCHFSLFRFGPTTTHIKFRINLTDCLKMNVSLIENGLILNY